MIAPSGFQDSLRLSHKGAPAGQSSGGRRMNVWRAPDNCKADGRRRMVQGRQAFRCLNRRHFLKMQRYKNKRYNPNISAFFNVIFLNIFRLFLEISLLRYNFAAETKNTISMLRNSFQPHLHSERQMNQSTVPWSMIERDFPHEGDSVVVAIKTPLIFPEDSYFRSSHLDADLQFYRLKKEIEDKPN